MPSLFRSAARFLHQKRHCYIFSLKKVNGQRKLTTTVPSLLIPSILPHKLPYLFLLDIDSSTVSPYYRTPTIYRTHIDYPSTVPLTIYRTCSSLISPRCTPSRIFSSARAISSVDVYGMHTFTVPLQVQYSVKQLSTTDGIYLLSSVAAIALIKSNFFGQSTLGNYGFTGITMGNSCRLFLILLNYSASLVV